MMSNNWEKVRLGDICEIKYGKDHKKLNCGNIPVYGTGGIMRYADEYLYEGESILIPRKGSLDNIYYVNERFWTVDTLFWTKINTSFALPKFLYYFLKTLNFTAMNVGSAVPSLTTKLLNEVQVNLPPLETQEKIANILSSLDDKIENNKKTAEKLEETAQTLFNRWFVEFNFPNENGLPYKDNGGEMVESELGLIPKGWEVVELGDISSIQNGYAFKSSDYVNNGCNMIRTTNIEDSGFVNNKELINLPYEFLDSRKYNQFNFENLDTVLVMVGASIGKIGLITEMNIPALQNQNMWRFRSENINISNVYIHYTVKLLNDKFQNWSNGSARQFFRKSVFSEAKVIQPSEIIMRKFYIIFETKFKYLSKLQLEIQQLKNLQENLLPKLMSSEMEV